MNPREESFLVHWYTARDSDFGIAVNLHSEPFPAVRATLYRVRRLADDPTLQSLQIKSIDGQLWIIKPPTGADPIPAADDGEEEGVLHLSIPE